MRERPGNEAKRYYMVYYCELINVDVLQLQHCMHRYNPIMSKRAKTSEKARGQAAKRVCARSDSMDLRTFFSGSSRR